MDKILVTRSSMPPLEEYIEEIRPLWENHWLTNMGEKHQELEKQIKRFLSVSYFSLFCNGHMALELAIQALGLRGEVITTPFTFASTTHAIVRNGLTPVFCDINPETYTLDVSKAVELITERTSAILPVHVYGNICDVEELEKIGREYHIKIIYDAAHAFGIRYKGKGIGTWGDASMFSFHATKVFHTIEGGGISYADKEFGRRLYQLKNFGIRDEVTVDGIGANAKMNEFQASMGICNLRHLEEEIAKRKAVVDRYTKRLSGVFGIHMSGVQNGVESNYAYYPIVIDEKEFGVTRDEVCQVLCRNNIFPRKYFYPLTNSFACYRGEFDVGETPVASYISERVLTLPLYADLEMEMVDRICDILIRLKK